MRDGRLFASLWRRWPLSGDRRRYLCENSSRRKLTNSSVYRGLWLLLIVMHRLETGARISRHGCCTMATTVIPAPLRRLEPRGAGIGIYGTATLLLELECIMPIKRRRGFAIMDLEKRK